MEKQTLKIRQAVCVKGMYLFGSSAIMGINFTAEQDTWLSILLAAVVTFPIFMVYARIMQLLPGRDFFEAFEELFGKVAGKVFTVLMGWYVLHLSALVFRDFSEFIEVCVMPETPQLPILIGMLLVVVYMAKSGVETMGRWASFMVIVMVAVVLMTVLFSVNKMDFSRILPAFTHGPGVMATSVLQIMVFPYLEIVVILCATGGMDKKDNPYKMYSYALLLGTVILMLTFLRNIFVLGPTIISREYFPSFIAAKIIDIGDLLTRLEGSIAMNFIIAGILKLTICLMATAKGISHFFGIPDYKRLLMPVGLLAVALSTSVFQSIMEMRQFLDIYEYYATLFQIFIPMAVWIAAEIKVRRQRKNLRPAEANVPRSIQPETGS